MIIAIDPGASGGIAVQYRAGGVTIVPMPETEKDVCQTLEDFFLEESDYPQPPVVYLEKVNGFMGNAMPGSAMFNFGEGYGFLKGVIISNEVRLEMVTPQAWQKELSLGTSRGLTKTQWKNKLKAKAQELYPKQKVTLKTADALLILEYAKRTMKGNF